MSIDLHAGADVFSSDGRKLGTLSRVVVNKDTLKLTHVVIDTGILRSGKPLWEGGWSLPHDRVVPLGALRHAASDRIELTMSADEFREHSHDYDTEIFQPVPDPSPGRLDLADLKQFILSFPQSIPGEPGPSVVFDATRRAPDEVDIKKDTPVWRLNPHQKIGEVERIIFDRPTRKISSLVIRRGFLFTYDVVLPAKYIADVFETPDGLVLVDMTDEDVDALKVFEEGEER
jgi:sporulation protein YlmC with PRC-barrel domain